MELKITASEELSGEIINRDIESIVYYKALFNEESKIIDFQFKFVNPAFLTIFKGNYEDYLGKTVLELLPGVVKSGIFAELIKTVETGVTTENEYKYKDDDKEGWVRHVMVKYDEGVIVYSKDITARKSLEVKLNKTLKEKETILKEIHHRVKNNLQIITSLINLQLNTIGNEEAKNILIATRNRISTIAIVHEKLYEGDSYENVNLAIYIADLINNLRKMSHIKNKNVYCLTDCDEIFCYTQKALNLGLIINELVINAMKYAFPDNREGVILVTAKNNMQSILVTVEDNGVGLPEGLNFRTQESLGMQIVSSLADQLEADVMVESKQGTKFIFRLNKGFFVN